MTIITNFFKSIIKIFIKIWKAAALFVGSGVLILIILMIWLIASFSGADDYFSPNSRVLEHGSEQEIAYVRLTGEIAYSTDDSWLGFNPFIISPPRVRQLFSYLAQRGDVRAVVLDINSPGGSVVASEEVYQQVLKLSLSKPVYVYFGEVAASGGYYIALPAEKIYASIPTITGSIGVVAFDPDLSGLFDKLGVQVETYQTGRFKDIGSVNRAATEEERQIFADLIDDSFQLFIDRIQENRNLERTQILALADGRIYSGQQAADNGLIDAVSTLDTVFSNTAFELNLDNPTIKEYFTTGSGFGSFLGAQSLNLLPNSLLNYPVQHRQGLHYLWVN